MIGESLYRFKKNQRYAVIDTETCNLNLQSEDNKVWQLGILECLDTKVVKTHNLYIKWDNLKVSKKAAEITGYNPQIIEEQGVSPQEAFDILNSYLYNPKYIKLWFNGLNFDVYILNIFCNLMGETEDYSYLRDTIDVHCLVKGIKFDVPIEESDDRLFWQYRVLNLYNRKIKSSLGHSVKEFQVEVPEGQLHDANYDNLCTFLLYHKLIWKIKF